MEVQPDFKDLLALLNAHNVEFIIVGSYALAFHGAPRFTGDIDVFVRPTPANAARIIEALTEFGFSSLGLTAADFLKPDYVVQLGVPPIRIDILTSISGVSWHDADAGKEAGPYGEVPVHYLGKHQYIQNKRAAGRKKDIADLDALGES